MGIRFASAADGGALLKVYEPYLPTPITFEMELPTEAAFTRRVEEIAAEYPYLVWEEGGEVLGYAYAHRERAWAAYQWNAELSIYLAREAAGRGAGRRLYRALMELLRLQGVRTVYGAVTVPNPASERLHESLGFRRIGVHQKAGYKDGAWRDVAWFEKEIAPHGPEPGPFTPLRRIPAAERRAALERLGEAFSGEP